MKKFIKHFCVFAMLVCTLFTITACGAKIEGISVAPETDLEFFVGETVDTSLIKVYGEYLTIFINEDILNLIFDHNETTFKTNSFTT